MNLKQNKMSIRTQFESELNKLKDKFEEDFEIINEAASDKALMALAQSSNPEKKQKLFEQCNKRFFGGKAPFGEPIFAENFNLELFNILNSKLQNDAASAASATKLFNIGGETTGIGRGEVLLAYLIENCIIGGGSQSIDLTLTDKNGNAINDKKCECKEAKKSKDGWLYGWRTAANHRSIIGTAKRDLRAIWNALKDIQPEFTNEKTGPEIADSMDRGEGSAFIKVVKDLHPIEIQIPLTFDIKELHGDLVISKVGGQVIGSLSDKKIQSELKILLKHQTKTRIKSYKTIEKELAEAFGKIKEKFVFCHSIGDKHKFGGFYFYENLPGRVGSMRISAMTAGTIKVEVKAN